MLNLRDGSVVESIQLLLQKTGFSFQWETAQWSRASSFSYRGPGSVSSAHKSQGIWKPLQVSEGMYEHDTQTSMSAKHLLIVFLKIKWINRFCFFVKPIFITVLFNWHNSFQNPSGFFAEIGSWSPESTQRSKGSQTAKTVLKN